MNAFITNEALLLDENLMKEKIKDIIHRICLRNRKVADFIYQTNGASEINESNISIVSKYSINAEAGIDNNTGLLSIRVYKGCFQFLDDEALQFLVAHEIGHLLKGHHETDDFGIPLIAFVICCLFVGLYLWLQLTAIVIIGLPFTQLIFLSIINKLIRKQEVEADVVGMFGSSPFAGIKLFKTIQEIYPNRRNKIINRVMVYFDTHPLLDDRIKLLENKRHLFNKNKNNE